MCERNAAGGQGGRRRGYGQLGAAVAVAKRRQVLAGARLAWSPPLSPIPSLPPSLPGSRRRKHAGEVVHPGQPGPAQCSTHPPRDTHACGGRRHPPRRQTLLAPPRAAPQHSTALSTGRRLPPHSHMGQPTRPATLSLPRRHVAAPTSCTAAAPPCGPGQRECDAGGTGVAIRGSIAAAPRCRQRVCAAVRAHGGPNTMWVDVQLKHQ